MILVVRISSYACTDLGSWRTVKKQQLLSTIASSNSYDIRMLSKNQTSKKKKKNQTSSLLYYANILSTLFFVAFCSKFCGHIN